MNKKTVLLGFLVVIMITGSVAGGFFLSSSLTDTAVPIVEITSFPTIRYQDATQWVQIEAADNTGIDTIWYNWNGTDAIYTGPHYVTFEEGVNTLDAWANDSTGNVAMTSISFIIDTTVITPIQPTIEIISPSHQVYTDASQLLEIQIHPNTEIDTIWYNWNGNNITYMAAQQITFNEGLNTIHAWANDTAGNVIATSLNFTIDTLSPAIEIISPINMLYYDADQVLNINTSDASGIATVWYNWDGINITYTSAQQITFDEGLNILHVWVNDSVGHVVETSVNFYIGPSIPANIFSSVWETACLGSGSSNSNQIRLPLDPSGTYLFEIDWGDSTSDLITSWNQPETLHTYEYEGRYTVHISGLCDGWRFNNAGAPDRGHRSVGFIGNYIVIACLCRLQ